MKVLLNAKRNTFFVWRISRPEKMQSDALHCLHLKLVIWIHRLVRFSHGLQTNSLAMKRMLSSNQFVKKMPPVNLSGTLWAGRPSDVKMFLPELWISCSASLRWKWRCTMRCSHCYFLCAVCMNNNYNIYNVGN